MPLDPDLAPLLQLVAASEPMAQQTPDQARNAFRALAVGFRKPEDVVPVGSVEDSRVPGAAGPRPARVYRPEGGAGSDAVPTVALFHGGGFVIGDLDTHDNMARAICARANAVVVSVDYRLAPEHKFPAGLEDALAATRHIQAELASYGGNDVLAVAGDSAGGNFCAVITQEVPGIAAQFLVYPATDILAENASRTDNAHGYFLDTPTMEWFFANYVSDSDEPDQPRISPLKAASFDGLPPAVIVTAEMDPLRDEGEAYAAALTAAGVHVELRRYDGMIHGFFEMGAFAPAAKAALEDSIDLFAALLPR